MKLHLVKHRIGSLTTALYLNAALLALIALLLIFRDRTPQFLPAAFGQNQPPIGGGAGVFIVPAQFSNNVFGCYLMDIDSQVLSAYQYFPPNNQLRLVASRSFRYDRQLKQYNSDSPTPPEVQKMVEQEQQGARVTDRNTEHAPVEAPKSE